MTLSSIRATPSQGTLPISCQDLIPIPFPPLSGDPPPRRYFLCATSGIFPILVHGPPPNQGSLFLMGARRRCLFPHPSLPYTGSSPPPPIQYSYQGPFSGYSSLHQGQSTTVPIPRRPPERNYPNNPEFSLPRVPATPKSSPHRPSPMSISFSYAKPCHSLHDPSSLLELPRPSPETTSSLGPSHSRTVSPSTHPLPGSGLARGPRGAGARWGPQWGGRAASMAAVAAERRRPPVPARPARQAPQRGGQAGQAARWVTTAAAAAGGGERRERGSARGTRGKGKAGGRGRGGLTLAPPAPPRAATRPWGPRCPAPHPGGPPRSAEPGRAGPD